MSFIQANPVWSPAYIVFGVLVGAGINEGLDHPRVTVAGGIVKRRSNLQENDEHGGELL